MAKALLPSWALCLLSVAAWAQPTTPDEEADACAAGNARACAVLGVDYLERDDVARGVELLNKACAGREVGACILLAMMHQKGVGVREDVAEAAMLLQKVCDQQEAAGCFGVIELEGRAPTVADLRRFCDSSSAACGLEIPGPLGRLYAAVCAGPAKACRMLAERYAQGDGVDANKERAAELYAKGCGLPNEGSADGEACSSLASMYFRGDGDSVIADAARSRALYERACGLGDGEGCSKLAFYHHIGMWEAQGLGERSATRAAEFYEKGCRAGHADSCDSLGTLYWEGEGVVGDKAKAVGLYREACTGASMFGCYNLGEAHLAGEGVQRDFAAAMGLFQKSCEGGAAAACTALGRMYDQGEAAPRDKDKAVAFYGKACEGAERPALDLEKIPSPQGCFLLGTLYRNGDGVPADKVKAATLFRKACEWGYTDGCFTLALLLERGDGIPKDAAQAAALYGKACKREDAMSCTRLGLMYDNGEGVGQDKARAADLYQKACDGGDAGGCFNLGAMYSQGEGVRQDMAKAVGPYQKACDGGNARGCFNLGVMYSQGEGVGQDKARAADLYQKACDGGDASGCFNLAVAYQTGKGRLNSGAAAAEGYHKSGLRFLQDGERDDALRCVERIQNLTKLFNLTVPNAFLADDLLSKIYGGGTSPEPTTQSQGSVTGTGWFVQPNRIVTNHHVVGNRAHCVVRLSDGRTLDARPIAADAANDLVILELVAPYAHPIRLALAARAPRVGEQVFVVGYPHPEIMGTEAKVTEGIVSALTGVGGDVRTLQVSAPIHGGNSGGPLFNARGEVVGIVVAKLDAAKVFQWTREMPENVGYAVKVQYLVPILDTLRPPATGTPAVVSRPGVRLADVVAAVSGAVVMVVAQ